MKLSDIYVIRYIPGSDKGVSLNVEPTSKQASKQAVHGKCLCIAPVLRSDRMIDVDLLSCCAQGLGAGPTPRRHMLRHASARYKLL